MPLQKSFSDQNHSSKTKQQRQPWRRNKSLQGGQAGSSRPHTKVLQEKPPMPVSAATKNKLGAFQFGGLSKGDHTEKSAPGLAEENNKENAVQPISGSAEKDQKLREEESFSNFTANDVPFTPAGKLALPDLIGMADLRRAAPSVSPDERVEWDHEKDMHQSFTSSFNGLKRARKRARSSSPILISSPAHTPTSFDAKGEPAIAPVDPGSELWGRYSLNGSSVSIPQLPAMPALVQIWQTSSPQPSKSGITPRPAQFRRVNSCGVQFPKRRRVCSGEDDDVFTESATVGPSKLSVLIERVQEGLSQPQLLLRSDATPKMSKLERRLPEMDQDSHTIARGKAAILTTSEGIPSGERENLSTGVGPISRQRQELPPSCSKSSDYGDGEIDDNDLETTWEVNHTKTEDEVTYSYLHVPAPKLPSDRSVAQPSRPSIAAVPHSTELLVVPKASRNTDPSSKDDEFDELDDGMFDEDLEHIVAEIEHQHSVTQTTLLASEVLDGSLKPSADPDSDDEFGGNGLEDVDFDEVLTTATQTLRQTAGSLLPSTQKMQAIQRYLVTTILDSEYEDGNDRMQKQKLLMLQIEHTKIIKVVCLRGTWLETPVTTKAFVHVIGDFDGDGRCVVDDKSNLLILHPDHLISATVVADSFGCTRRAVLQERVKATSDSSPPLVYGTILHEIFQAAMLANRWDTKWLHELVENVATRHLEDLYKIKLQIPAAVEYLLSKLPELQAWAELFVSSRPKPDALVKAGNGETASMCITKLLDVEEHVWSPMYGLKGNIDATVQVTMRDGQEEKTLTVPIEVKTGKNATASHRAQTALYNLLLSDRYDIEIACGILYYLETSETVRIPTIRHELRHMIMQRNELACFVRERHAQLPPMLKRENMCGRCYAKVPCFIYHKLADDGSGETSAMKDRFEEVVKHLTPTHKAFFLKWDDLLTKEEKECLKFRRELWTMLSSEREKLGRCFSNVFIEPGSAYEDPSNPKINRYRYTMIKQSPPPGFSFLDSQIILGEPIVISDEKGHFALANGYVTNVRKQRITVAVDRRLHNARIRGAGFDAVNNQVFASIMEVAQEGATPAEVEGKIVEEPMRYRLDKDEFSNGMSLARNNIIQVMADGPYGSRQIRNMVVDLVAPRFKAKSTQYVLRDRANINIDQRRAIEKVMSAEDYALVLGMPGTGKTTTIAHIIRALVSQSKSVLLASYTHTAVDNILLKLKDDNIPILRLGQIGKIAPDVQEFATLAAKPKSTFEDIRSAWHDTPIVATTCLGINHAIFNERTFDYCIVDEASQITLPVCLGPIRLARTFILVGDHNQLPPLVQNEEARTGGLDISLFKHLSDQHPSSVVYLEHQYRMCEDVMALSNSLIYNGRLKCGSQSVAERCTTIPNMDLLRNHHYTSLNLSRSQKAICLGAVLGRCWIRDLLDPERKVAFINTDPLLPISREGAKGNRIVNPTEATICTQLVESLLTVGVLASSIGVMTHYRSQLALLKHGLRNHSDVEMHTADRFQGRDKEVIILSLVRSNEARSIGELLKDWRRINVAFTRAKTKLLVIGSRETLKGNGVGKEGEQEEMVARFVCLMEEKNWIYDMRKGALEEHLFEDVATQVPASVASKPASIQFKEMKVQLELEVEKGKRKFVPDEEEKENLPVVQKKGLGTRQPGKKICGNKPFKISQMSVLRDVVEEMMH